MPKPKSADLKDRAAAGMQAFGKGKQPIKGPVQASPLPPALTQRGGPPPSNAPMMPIPPSPQVQNTGMGQGKKKTGKGQSSKKGKY